MFLTKAHISQISNILGETEKCFMAQNKDYIFTVINNLSFIMFCTEILQRMSIVMMIIDGFGTTGPLLTFFQGYTEA